MANAKDFKFDRAFGFTGSASGVRKFAGGGAVDPGATDSASYDDMPDAPASPWDSVGQPLVGYDQATETDKRTGKVTVGKREPLYGRSISKDEFNKNMPKSGRAKGGLVKGPAKRG